MISIGQSPEFLIAALDSSIIGKIEPVKATRIEMQKNLKIKVFSCFIASIRIREKTIDIIAK